MTLADILSSLDSFDPEGTIYATEPWTRDSAAIVAREPETGALPDEAEALGMKYFLEVFVARDFVADWKSALRREPTPQQTCDRLIRYAIHDA